MYITSFCWFSNLSADPKADKRVKHGHNIGKSIMSDLVKAVL